MKDYHAADIRNFAICGHASSGKTMLAESMLACAKQVNRLGSIEAGTTVSDHHADEREHKISIHASLMRMEWLDKKLNIIDTPGYTDFLAEAISSLGVADFSMIVVSAEDGVQLNTRRVFEASRHYKIPPLIVMNGLDREHSNFDKVLDDLRKAFGREVFPMNIPLNPGAGFSKVLDVMRSEVVEYATDGSGTYKESPAEGADLDRVKELHGALIEFVAEADDGLLETFFEKGSLSEEEMRAGLHRAFQTGAFIPLFTTAASANIGVARLLDFVSKFGSSPVDRKKVTGEDAGSGDPVEVALDDKDPTLFVFKTLNEEHVGELSFFRVYSGSVHTGIDLKNASNGASERLGQIFLLNGKDREAVKTLYEGDIGVAVKLRNTHTGNTLCGGSRQVKLPMGGLPKPSMRAALVVASKGDEDKLSAGLATLHEEDPTFLYHVDPELNQTVIEGQGDLHLQLVGESMKRRFGVEVQMVQPRIAYRETIRAKAEAKYRHKKQSGGAGQFAEVWMRIAPNERDAGIDFKESLVGQNVDRVFVPSVEKGVQSACQEGVLAGYRIVDVAIDFYDGKMHPVDSKDVAFQIAGRAAFREAFMAAKPCLLEPIMNLRIQVPESAMGDVIGDISQRRGRVIGMDTAESGMQIIEAQAPQAELYRWATTLRSLTGGRGVHEESPSHYEQVPPEIEQALTKAEQSLAHA